MVVAFFILETKDILSFTSKHIVISTSLGLYRTSTCDVILAHCFFHMNNFPPICLYKFAHMQLLTTPEGGDNPSNEMTVLQRWLNEEDSPLGFLFSVSLEKICTLSNVKTAWQCQVLRMLKEKKIFHLDGDLKPNWQRDSGSGSSLISGEYASVMLIVTVLRHYRGLAAARLYVPYMSVYMPLHAHVSMFSSSEWRRHVTLCSAFALHTLIFLHQSWPASLPRV